VAVDANILASTYFWSQTSIRFWFSTTRLFRICNSQTNSNLVLITHFSLIWVTLNEKNTNMYRLQSNWIPDYVDCISKIWQFTLYFAILYITTHLFSYSRKT
jgi:hypothetical protein